MRRQRKGFAYDSAVLWQEEISKSGVVRNDLEDQALHWDNFRQWDEAKQSSAAIRAPILAALSISRCAANVAMTPSFSTWTYSKTGRARNLQDQTRDEPDTTGSLLARQV